MATPVIESALTTGEVSPGLFGNVSLARMHAAASTMRNFFVRYSGGAYSRAGTALVGPSKQTGRQFPPRLISFQFSINQGLVLEFGHLYMRVIIKGAYVTEPTKAILNISRTSPGTVTAPAHGFNNLDWVFIASASGMTQINNQTYIIANVTPNTFDLFDIYGNPFPTTSFPAYLGGGTVARIYNLNTIYNEQDLQYLKFTQSADVMSLCCVNQVSGAEYQPQDLARFSDTNWVFTPAVPTPTVTPPTTVAITASGAGTTNYAYVVTAVSPKDGTESIASPVGVGANLVDIAATAGSIFVAWTTVLGINQYNIYKATPSHTVPVPAAVQFGFVGTAYGVQFVDNNTVADFTQVPPLHKNPFARGQVISINPTAGGAGYTAATVAITSATGTGAVVKALINGAGVVAYLVQDAGQNYQAGDVVVVAGDGAGAIATIQVGPQSGTYPGVVAYFQERRAYASTINQPDTYFMSQPGAFTNFDSRIPPIASDAITGTPWSEEVNGIQFMVSVTGGLIAMTGLEAYLVTGTGGNVFSPQPLTPSSQQAQPEGFNGCSPTVPPIRIYQDVIYVQAKGATYRDFSFDVSTYTYTGIDLTLNSSHLFIGQNIVQHAWCEEPFKILWGVRGDGVLLSLTYQKKEQIAGWARHDTYGSFVSVCSVTEPPVDALYLAVKRPFNVNVDTYMIERMDNRVWSAVENTWCVDCGLSLAQPTPNAILGVSFPANYGSVTGATNLVGGANYSVATVGSVIDAPVTPNGPAGPGVGAVPTLTIVNGVVTNIAFAPGNQGSGYVNPQIVLYDPAGSDGGSGASATLTLFSPVNFTATSPVFSPADVGSVIRMSGGIATVTSYSSPTTVNGVLTTLFSQFQPNITNTVIRGAVGSWSITKPVTTINGLISLAGQTVGGLADGVPITPRVVSALGQVVLDQPASQVTLGLPFQAQLQTTYLDAGEPTVQGQRKKVGAVTVRVEASGAFLVGSNQPDGSTLSPPQLAPIWTNMVPAATGAVPSYNGAATPLYTGDVRIPVQGGFQKPGQVCIQQDLPLPVEVLALISETWEGDNPAQAAPNPQK